MALYTQMYGWDVSLIKELLNGDKCRWGAEAEAVNQKHRGQGKW